MNNPFTITLCLLLAFEAIDVAYSLCLLYLFTCTKERVAVPLSHPPLGRPMSHLPYSSTKTCQDPSRCLVRPEIQSCSDLARDRSMWRLSGERVRGGWVQHCGGLQCDRIGTNRMQSSCDNEYGISQMTECNTSSLTLSFECIQSCEQCVSNEVRMGCMGISWNEIDTISVFPILLVL
jgi:hypothetical protein